MSEKDEFETLTSAELTGIHGGMHPAMFSAMQKAYDMGLQVRWLHTGGHAEHSAHYRGRAMDLGGSHANLMKFVKWAKGTKYHELIYRDLFMKDGRRRHGIGNHQSHVHYSV